MEKKSNKSFLVLNSENSLYPELNGLKFLSIISVILIVTDYLMPQYFGIHIGYDMTCTRICIVIIIVYLIINRKAFQLFCQVFLKQPITIPAMLYLFVALYTMILRINIGSFLVVFLEMLTLYMLIFLIRYVVGIKKAIIWSIRCAYFLGVEGIIEFAYGGSIYHRLLSTMPNIVTDGFRSGHYRVMGPCGHSLAYGLVLILLIALASLDIEKDEIYIFKRPVLLALLVINVFLTGSRSTLGIVVVEVAALIIFSPKEKRKQSLFFLLVACLGLGVFLLIFHGTSVGRYMLMQLTSVLDQALGTSYAQNFGADVEALENSDGYREALQKVYTLSWLNPLLGKGTQYNFGAYIDGVYLNSVDSYYILQYIKYAYPGLITYILFMAVNVVCMIRTSIKYNSGAAKAVLIAFVGYFINLWWVDALQTLKYVYILVAIFFAYKMLIEDVEAGLECEMREL